MGSIGFAPTAIVRESAARVANGVSFRTNRLGDGAAAEIVTLPLVVFDAVDVAGLDVVAAVGPAAGGTGSAVWV